jgi:chloramphenicol 3-O phosphotransferase
LVLDGQGCHRTDEQLGKPFVSAASSLLTKGQGGTLIVLNGGSSAGKTSTAEALQDVLDEPYLLMGIDILYRSLSPTQKDHDRVDPDCYSVETTIENGKEYFRLIPGPVLNAFVSAHYSSIARMLESGVNIISDQVFWSSSWVLEAVQVFQPFRAFMIGVFVSDEEAERRHHARGRSGAGWYRGSARLTHSGVVYDLKIDTTNQSPLSCANQIKAAVDEEREPSAFARMRRVPAGKGIA